MQEPLPTGDQEGGRERGRVPASPALVLRQSAGLRPLLYGLVDVTD